MLRRSYAFVLLFDSTLPSRRIIKQPRHPIPDPKRYHTTSNLHSKHPDRESILLHRPPRHQYQIQNREIRTPRDLPLVPSHESHQPQCSQNLKYSFEQSSRTGKDDCETRFEQACLLVESWQSMARAGDDAGELRERVEEVEDLGEEEEEERLAEVAEDTDDCEGHSAEVTEGVPDEGTGGVPVIRRVSVVEEYWKVGTDQLCLSSPRQTPMSGSMR